MGTRSPWPTAITPWVSPVCLSLDPRVFLLTDRGHAMPHACILTKPKCRLPGEGRLMPCPMCPCSITHYASEHWVQRGAGFKGAQVWRNEVSPADVRRQRPGRRG